MGSPAGSPARRGGPERPCRKRSRKLGVHLPTQLFPAPESQDPIRTDGERLFRPTNRAGGLKAGCPMENLWS